MTCLLVSWCALTHVLAQTPQPSPTQTKPGVESNQQGQLGSASVTPSPTAADREAKQKLADDVKKSPPNERVSIVAYVWTAIIQFHSQHIFLAIFLDVFVGFVAIGILANVLPVWGNYTWYPFIILVVFVCTSLSGDTDYFWVFVLGMATAFAEIISKFRDEPLQSIKTGHAVVYHLFNGVIAVFALYVLNIFTPPSPSAVDHLKKIVVAGLGAMLVMRSKLFNIKVGGEDVSFGPEQIVKILLSFMEGAIDRIRAINRIDFSNKQVEVLDFEKFDDIADYVTAMMRSSQTRTLEQTTDFETKISNIRGNNGPKSKRNKCYALSFELLNAMGEGFAVEVFTNVPPDFRKIAPITPQGPGLLARWIPGAVATPQEDTQYYLAYGTDMWSPRFRERLQWSEEDFRKLPTAKNGKLSKYRIIFDKPSEEGVRDGCANIVPDENGDVEGVLYTLSKSQIEFLDTRTVGYTRKTVSVATDGKFDKFVDAEVYIANATESSLKPNAIAVSDVVKGAEEHHLSDAYMTKLRALATSSTE